MALYHSLTSFGATVCGPAHVNEGMPNQDAWYRASGRFGSLIVVCDGLGSRPHAALGARAACRAVHEAARRWLQRADLPLSHLVDLIEMYWRLRIYPHDPQTAATTCLIALASVEGEWIVGGMGDGLAAVRCGTDPVQLVKGTRGSCFCNETEALGITSSRESWQLVRLAADARPQSAILASDGVADDLNLEKVDRFCQWLEWIPASMAASQRSRFLATELRNWPTPRHVDDKTLAVLTTPQNLIMERA